MNIFAMEMSKWKTGTVSRNEEFSPGSIFYRYNKISIKAEVPEPLPRVVKD